MLMRKIILLILFITLDAVQLKPKYFINSNNIYISNIIKDVKKDQLLYKINTNRHSKRINAKNLIFILKENGYHNIKTKNNYITFIKKSPINTSKIKNFIKKFYKKNYDNIDIKNIQVEPRSYLLTLPTNYTVEIKSKNYLSKNGILDIKTKDKKKIFFNYTIDAHISIYFSKDKIKKSNELTTLNTVKKSIILNKFKAKPIKSIKKVNLEAKHNIKKDTIITVRDVEKLSLVKRNSLINVFIINHNLSISFSAKALDSGKLGDTIRVQKSDNKRLKAVVVGKNIAEIK